MAAESLSEELLRASLMRLSRGVVRTYPQFGEMLAQNMMRTRSAAPDLERAGHFQELGVLLMDLGRLYLAESDVLLAASGAAELPESEGMEWEGRSRGLGGA